MGRHSREEVEKFGLADLQSLSDYLGDKQFFMGDSPSEVDATIFAFLCMVLCGPEDSVLNKGIEENMGNLKAYFDRLKEKYWSDWDDVLYKEPEKPVKEKKDKKEEEGEEKKDEEKKEDDEEKKEEGKEEEKKEE